MVGLPTLTFTSQKEWEDWLSKHFAQPLGVWLRLFKKDSHKQTFIYAEALDVALCYGWIDGQKKSYDPESWLQHFGPRRPRSVWSKINTGHVKRLIKEGRMQPSGLMAVEAAKADGRWANAYDAQSNSVVPDEFLVLLKVHPKALAFFETLNKANRYAVIYQLNSVKKEQTKLRRMQKFLAMFEKGEKPYP